MSKPDLTRAYRNKGLKISRKRQSHISRFKVEKPRCERLKPQTIKTALRHWQMIIRTEYSSPLSSSKKVKASVSSYILSML